MCFIVPQRLIIGNQRASAIRNTRECHLGIQTDDIAGLLVRNCSLFVSSRTCLQHLLFLKAVIRVLETALSGSQELVIKTDSRYALNCLFFHLNVSSTLTYSTIGVEAIVHIWLTDGWHTSQNKATLNRPLVQYCAALIQYLSLRGLCIKISYSEDEKCTRELASQAVHLPDGRTTNWDTKRLSLWNYTTTMHRSLIIHEMRMEVKIRFHLTMKKEKVAIVHLLSSRMNDALLTWHEAFQNVQTSDLDSNLSSHDSDTTEQSDTSKRSATETPRELSSPQASKPQASSRLGASTIDTESNLRKDDDNFDYYSVGGSQ